MPNGSAVPHGPERPPPMPAAHHRSLARCLRVACASLALVASAGAQSNAALHTGHAIPGFHGFESSVRPPLGLSFDNVTMFYRADMDTDRHGNDTGTSGSVQHLSNHSTLNWLSPWRIFGANYVARLRVSLANSAPHPRSIDAGNRGFKIGDTYLEPLSLYWLGERGYLSFRYGLWWDTGSFEAGNLNSSGKGFKTHQVSLGFTYYPDVAKRWNLSLLGRYGRHGQVDGLDLRPGDDLVLDWAAGRRLGERWNAGLVGYGVFQTSRDEGADANKGVGYYGNGGIGFGVKYDLPSIAGSAELRAYQEFSSYNHTEGQTGVLGLNFRF